MGKTTGPNWILQMLSDTSQNVAALQSDVHDLRVMVFILIAILVVHVFLGIIAFVWGMNRLAAIEKSGDERGHLVEKLVQVGHGFFDAARAEKKENQEILQTAKQAVSTAAAVAASVKGET